MTIQQIDIPSTARVVLRALAGTAFCTLCAGTMWAMRVANFIPSRAAEALGIVGGLAFGVLGGLFSANYHRISPDRITIAPENFNALVGALIDRPPFQRFCTMFVVWFLMAYASLDITVSEIVTLATGAPGLGAATVSSWSSAGLSQSAHFEVDELGFMFHSPFSATYADGQTVQKGATLALTGKVSPLGIEVQHWEAQPSD